MADLKADDQRFVVYFWFVSWDCISLGLHVCPTAPNIEIHLPFGFIRIGWESSGLLKYRGRRGFGWLRGGWNGSYATRRESYFLVEDDQ